VKVAGAMNFTAKLLRGVRWERFLRARFWGAALSATILVQLVVNPAEAPSGAAPKAGADAGRPPYVSFSAQLREAYAEFARREAAMHGPDFDGAPFAQNLKLLDERIWPKPMSPAALRLDGAAAIAIDEGRLRLLRLYDLAAREAYPRQSAGAQTALECWATRAAARRDHGAIAECERQFFAAVVALEDWLLPLRTADPFHRRLAREYLAYAHYKAAVEGDQIDARHFADKGLRAAEAQPLEPEELARWFGVERGEARDLSVWRIRLGTVLEKHRAGARAVTAAIALARYDCWIERAAERAGAAHADKCRGEFIDAMRRLEEGVSAESERVEVRFDYDRLALAPAEREKIARAARNALERNAIVSVAAVAWPKGHAEVEARHAWRRAESVVDALRGQGVSAERIRVLQRPALAAETAPGVRRVDIVLE